MKIGLHLPVVSFFEQTLSQDKLREFSLLAEKRGFSSLAVLDHFSWFSLPLLDGMMGLTVAACATDTIRLVTSVALPVLRGPVATAKFLGSLDVLSNGRISAGLGPGSNPSDYALAGIPWEERWARFDDAINCIRSLLDGRRYEGRYYTAETLLFPLPVQQHLPLFVGSWGSEKGLARVARLSDGWIASAFNIDTTQLPMVIAQLEKFMTQQGKPSSFPVIMSTMFTYIEENSDKAEMVLRQLSSILRKPLEDLRQKLLIGGRDECLRKLREIRDAGIQEVFLLLLKDELEQIEQISSIIVSI